MKTGGGNEDFTFFGGGVTVTALKVSLSRSICPNVVLGRGQGREVAGGAKCEGGTGNFVGSKTAEALGGGLVDPNFLGLCVGATQGGG